MAMIDSRQEQLVALLEPVIEQLGYELADIEVNTSGGGLVQVFIDREAGIGVEDCAIVSRQISALLDVEDPIPGEYNLEVSSPGLNRRLVKGEHFERFAGNKVKVKLKRLINGRRRFSAQLVGFEEPNVVLQKDNEQLLVPLNEIDMARLVPEL